MHEHGAEHDDWPTQVWPHIGEADILIIGTPLWLGEESSLCRVVIERLCAYSAQTNEKRPIRLLWQDWWMRCNGHNEDGVKHASMTVLYSLQHVGFVVLPQADCGWIGEVGPGPSYGDNGAGLTNNFTSWNATFMTWNLMHMARMLKERGGMPVYGNVPQAWQDRECFEHPELAVLDT